MENLARTTGRPGEMMNTLLDRLKQRKLGQWALAYIVGAWVVIQLLDALSGPLRLSEAFQQGVLVLLPIGLLLALVLAWYHGEKGRQRVAGSELLWIAALLGTAGMALTLLPSDQDADTIPTPTERDELAVAVLPFANLSPEPESGYFSEALTDEIIGRLSRIEGVTVVSRTSVARFRDTELDVKEIAGELGVRYVLEGGVRKSGDRVRITVQLTEASSGFEEWTEVFQGASDDWFQLHEDLALRITDALDLHLSPQESEVLGAHYAENTEAYDAFWRGWVLLESFHVDMERPDQKLVAAEEHLDHALSLDPDYALAVAGLSIANAYYWFYGTERTDERRQHAEVLARRALALDSELPEAHVALGLALGSQANRLAAVDAYREALRLDDDNAMVWCLLAAVCNSMAPPDARTAESAARESLIRDPTWFYSHAQLGRALEYQGRYQEAATSFGACQRQWDTLRG